MNPKRTRDNLDRRRWQEESALVIAPGESAAGGAEVVGSPPRHWRAQVARGMALTAVIAHGLLNIAQEANAPAAANPAAQTNASAMGSGSTSARRPDSTKDFVPPRVAPPINSAVGTGATTRLDFSAFKLITDRNIFDPNRSPRRPGGGNRPKLKVTESISLVGTMSYEKGAFAFFDGTSSEYRKVLKPAEAIAGYKVTNIAPNHVKLASGTNELELRVGMQLRREEEGEWLLAGQSVSYADSITAPTPTAEPAAASGGDDSDIVKRMMQRREKE